MFFSVSENEEMGVSDEGTDGQCPQNFLGFLSLFLTLTLIAA